MRNASGWLGKINGTWLLVLSIAPGLLTTSVARAHPLGNFAICHYTRLRADADVIRLRYVLDLAEIPTVAEKKQLDADQDGVVSRAEQTAYLEAMTPRLLSGLTLRVNDRSVPLHVTDGAVCLAPGAGGLDTLKIRLHLRAEPPKSSETYTVFFQDHNFRERTGWKEIIAQGGEGRGVRNATVSSVDRSQELSAYPADVIPPQDTEACFTVVPAPTTASASPPTRADVPSDATPRDAFTQIIASRELGVGVMALGLLIAVMFGALHALSPGHGKAMVAAYLVGSRGTARHAIFLGVLVTITHTFGVFALGLIALFASRYVVPERLYPLLSVVSGLIVCGVGLRLLYRRIRRLLAGDARSPRTTTPGHHHELPLGPVSARTLLALGISGGIVPCPSALVVLLAAVALHRIAYGLLLIGAFSCGLGVVLVAIGLLVVHARGWLDQFAVSRALLRRIPVASAAVITLIGIALVVRALS